MDKQFKNPRYIESLYDPGSYFLKNDKKSNL